MAGDPDARAPEARDSVDRGLTLIVLLLIAYRLAYHASYLGEVPFAHATFSDGSVYEAAALDILDHPPLGTEAFYLQGAYAYLLALGMAIRPWPSFGLLVQLLLAFATLALAHRTVVALWGRRAGLLSTIALLAHPGLSFYENKYLSAELGIAANVVVFAVFVAVLDRGRRARLLVAVGLGLASGFAILARPNMILALPFTLVAMVALTDGEDLRARLRSSLPTYAAVGLGTLLAVAPMAIRNQVVTGYPDIQPVHGGGTSFYIGNNPSAKGVWNDAGILSAQLATESLELGEALGTDPSLSDHERAKANGKALYARGFTWIRENPGAWVALEFDKLWLTIGDQQLTQDYDWLGERELLPWTHRVGVSFSLLLALGLLGIGALFGGLRPRPDRAPDRLADARARRALAWFTAGQLLAPLAANLLFFTSAQHRLPLVIPLAVFAGPGLLALIATARAWTSDRRGSSPRLPIALLVAAALLVVQGPWPRSKRTQPSPVHYYNLAMTQDSIGEPIAALRSLDRALELGPDRPIFLLRRAHLRIRLGDFVGANQDLLRFEAIAERETLPAWMIEHAKYDAATISYARRNQPP